MRRRTEGSGGGKGCRRGEETARVQARDARPARRTRLHRKAVGRLATRLDRTQPAMCLQGIAMPV